MIELLLPTSFCGSLNDGNDDDDDDNGAIDAAQVTMEAKPFLLLQEQMFHDLCRHFC